MPDLKSQRDEPGTLREYETIYILRPNANSDQVQEVNARVRKIIEGTNGKVLRLDNWGKRKLAYEIRKQLKGIYLYWLYLGNAALVAEIERNLRMMDACIRYFTVAVDENVHPEVRPTSFDDDTFAAAATIIPDEEDAYMGRTYSEDGEEKAETEEGKAEEEEAGAGEDKADAEEEEAGAGEDKADAEEEETDAEEEKPAPEEEADAEEEKPAPEEEKPAPEEEKTETEEDEPVAEEEKAAEPAAEPAEASKKEEV